MGARATRALLWPLSLLYALGWRCYAGWYRLGFKKRRKPDFPIIGIGSLLVGGSGKTPATIALAKLLLYVGYRPAISCSGYGGDGRLRVLEPGETALTEQVGDEAVEIREALPTVPIVVGRNRLTAAELIAARADCHALILDDGFQHLPLARDVDFLVMDAERPFGNGLCLPAGPLREPRSFFRRAHAVLSDRDVGFRLTYPMQRQPVELRSLAGERQDLEWLKGKSVTALSALGNPRRFEAALTEFGATVTPCRFPDHHHYRAEDLRGLTEPIVTTAKDAVKLRPLKPEAEIWVLIEEATFLTPEELIAFLIDRTRMDMRIVTPAENTPSLPFRG